MIEKKTVLKKGRALKHEIPEVMNRSDFSEHSIDVMETFFLTKARSSIPPFHPMLLSESSRVWNSGSSARQGARAPIALLYNPE